MRLAFLLIFIQAFFLIIALTSGFLNSLLLFSFLIVCFLFIFCGFYLGGLIRVKKIIKLHSVEAIGKRYALSLLLIFVVPILIKMILAEDLFREVILREFYSESFIGPISFGILLQCLQVFFLIFFAYGKVSHHFFWIVLFLSLLSGTKSGFLYFTVVYCFILIKFEKFSMKTLLLALALILFLSFMRSSFFNSTFDMSNLLAYTVYPFSNFEYVADNPNSFMPAIVRFIELKSNDLGYDFLHADFRDVGEGGGVTNVYTMYADYIVLFGYFLTLIFLFIVSFLSSFLYNAKDKILSILGAHIVCYICFGFFNEKILLSYSFYPKYFAFIFILVALTSPVLFFRRKEL